MDGSSGTVDGAGEGGSPHLTLDGFDGSLALLLAQARAHQIDLSTLRLPELIDQLADRLERARATIPLGHQADWVVMASWILLLRSDLLLPRDAPAQEAAERRASDLRDRLVALQEIQALGAWLEQRPQLGRDVFPRDRSEAIGSVVGGSIEVDMIAFLWACLEQFDDPADAVDTRPIYRLPALDLYDIPEARDRILRLLAESGGALSLGQLLPGPNQQMAQPQTETRLRRRSAWSSTFVAGLELAKQGDVELAQAEDFDPIIVSVSSGDQPPPNISSTPSASP
ncbi:segregation and condensation protein A [Acidiphilium angustum]|uniref:Segregation and condensation protein A n=2 Tax=Acidiphilium rubrum TaxID=526 RepID=A0A8G2CP49_ACIRU|nr:segregation/condensation protein A [Acidiphilium angustum]SIR55793.1 segregation and condensation protein A [Acidiphilium rubrum]